MWQNDDGFEIFFLDTPERLNNLDEVFGAVML